MIVLSQVVTVAIVSTPTRCCSCSAMFSESMWVRAFSRGCTTTSPMPFACSTAAAWSLSPAQPPAGGVSAAPTTKRRAASSSASDPAPWTSAVRGRRSAADTRGAADAAPRVRTASAAALMCVGVVPQQPPTSVIPASANRPRYLAK